MEKKINKLRVCPSFCYLVSRETREVVLTARVQDSTLGEATRVWSQRKLKRC